MNKTCAVTGHRPERFQFRYNEEHTLCKKIKRAIWDEFKRMYDEQRVRRIYVGGALGVDMWAGEITLHLKETPGYGELRLHIALPFEGHDSKWAPPCRERLAFLIRHSAECVTVGNTGSRESYLARNRYMVDHADLLLAVYDGEKKLRSGTMHTVNYARKKHLPVMLIHPDIVQVPGMTAGESLPEPPNASRKPEGVRI